MKKLLTLVALLLIVPTPAHSEHLQKASGETATTSSAETSKKMGDEWLNVEISTSERETIRNYFLDHPQAGIEHPKSPKAKKLPPGLQKKAARGCPLPPGWQKKIVKGEVLSMEVYQHSKRFPIELTKRLPPAPDGTVLVKVEGKVIRLYEATRTILDVFDLP